MKAIQKLMLRYGISQKLFSDVGIIFFANLGNNGIAFIINVAIAKYFSYEMFGQFSIAINVATTVQAVLEFGMNLTMIRLYAEYYNDKTKSTSVILWNILFKILQSIIVIIIALFISGYLSSLLLPEYGNVKLIFYALVSGVLLLLWEFFKSFFQLQNRFRTIAVYTLLYSMFRLISLVYIYFVADSINVVNVFFSVYLVPLTPLLLCGFIFLFKDVKPNKRVRSMIKHTEKEYINYSKWVALGSISFILMQSSVVLMVSVFSNLKNVSLISAGMTFTAIFNLFNASATQVLIPKTASFRDVNIIEYKSKLIKILPLIIFCGFLVICLFSGLMYFVLGISYKDALPVFWISSVGSIIVSWLGFFTLVLHSIKRPDINGIVNILSLILFLLGGYYILNYTKLSITIFVSYYVFITVAAEYIKRYLIDKIILSTSMAN